MQKAQTTRAKTIKRKHTRSCSPGGCSWVNTRVQSSEARRRHLQTLMSDAYTSSKLRRAHKGGAKAPLRRQNKTGKEPQQGIQKKEEREREKQVKTGKTLTQKELLLRHSSSCPSGRGRSGGSGSSTDSRKRRYHLRVLPGPFHVLRDRRWASGWGRNRASNFASPRLSQKSPCP